MLEKSLEETFHENSIHDLKRECEMIDNFPLLQGFIRIIRSILNGILLIGDRNEAVFVNFV